MLSLCIASVMIITSQALCVWDGTGCYDDGCNPDQRQTNCAKFEAEDACKSDTGADNRCTWSSVSAAKEEQSEHRLIRAHDTIDLQPMRDCTQCWECYACTHDEHYGTVGNCVPIMGCEPSECYGDDECGAGRTCVQGSCQECAMSSDCSDGRECYYGQCRDTCNDHADCKASYSGDMCEHGMCVCAGSEC